MDLLEGCTLRKCIRDKKEFNEKQIENHKDLGQGDRGAGSTRQDDPPH